MEYGIIVDHNGYERFGDDKYKKVKAHGFSCADYNMSDTETPLYEATEEVALAMLCKEKKQS